MFCWGSWWNSFKLAGKWRFELFYWDFILGVAVAAVIAAFTFGSLGFDGLHFSDNLFLVGRRNMVIGMGAGAVFNLGNMLLLAAVSVAGMSVALPVGLGIALIVATFWSQASHPQGNPTLLLTGLVLLAAVSVAGPEVALPVGLGISLIVARFWSQASHPQGNPTLLLTGLVLTLTVVAVTTYAYLRMALAKAKQTIKGGNGRGTVPAVSWKATVLSVVGGLLLGSSYPLVEISQEGYGQAQLDPLGPYVIVFMLAGGILFSTVIYNLFFMNLPVQGAPVGMLEYLKGTLKQHALGLAGGVLWAVGAIASFVVASAPEAHLAPALTYGLGQGAAVVGALWGLLAWKEFRDSDAPAKILMGTMVILFAAGVALVSAARIYP
ncbi:MAG: hypothetical protein ACLQGV_20025 [Bryobacteraceae bacterium]